MIIEVVICIGALVIVSVRAKKELDKQIRRHEELVELT